MVPAMFANPLGLLALLAVPAVVALHLYRRRFEPRPVSALFLWGADDRAPVAGRKREPLRTSVSFWCELLAVALLALAFSGPRSGCAAGHSEHLVVVLDSSASMGAVAEGKSTRERALELIAERIDGLGRGSRVTLVQSGPRPSLVAGPAAFPAEAREALAQWVPGAAHHDLQPAVALALQFAGEARVTLVTDHYEPEN
ncbi:MAG TPA: BatA and WFA domain-containing protein, partial [Methylomirabilota bacterium]|nr:BatA and WFA domain-containing protein [Methylomirabilota bacterium]